MRSSSHIARLGALALLFPLLGAGCSGSTTTDANGGINLGGINVASPSDSQGTRIPDNFPADAPRYPDSRTVMTYTENNGKTASLVQETSETLAQAQARIESLMQGQGFTKDNVAPSAELVIMSFSKGTVRYQINIAKQANGTQIQSTRVEL
jgi:hypothetical protein